MRIYVLFSFIFISGVTSEDNKWIWDNNNNNNNNGRSHGSVADPRYEIHENVDDFENFDTGGPFVGFRPQHTVSRPQKPIHGNRPFVSTYPNNNGVLVGPGGPTGIIGRPHQPSGSIIDYDDNLDSGHVHNQNPRGSRYREYDTCKCRYSFNCPSAGLKFGSCADGKRYCCFNGKRYPALVSGDPRDRH